MAYSVAICIPTYERPELVRDFLENCAAYHIEAGIDIYYYDSSEGNDTEAIVRAWPDQEHVFYVKLPPDLSLNEKILYVLQGHGLKREYDFLSLSNDATQHSAEAVDRIVSHLDLKYDFIDVGYEDGLETGTYSDPNEYLLQCVESIQHIGATFLNRRTMLTGVDWQDYERRFRPVAGQSWANMGADLYFYCRRFLELEDFLALHIQITKRMRRTSALKRSSFYEKDMIRYVCEGWTHTFEQLPDAYTGKWIACRRSACGYITGDVSDFYLYKRQGSFSLPVFLRYWSVWPKVTSIPRYKLALASLPPRRLLELRYERRKERGSKKLETFCAMFPRIVIYGAGNHGYAYGEYLRLRRLTYDAYCVSSRKPGKDFFAGHPVYELAELEPDMERIGFIVAMQKTNAEAVLSTLREKVGQRQIFYDPALESDIRYGLGYQAFSNV